MEYHYLSKLPKQAGREISYFKRVFSCGGLPKQNKNMFLFRKSNEMYNKYLNTKKAQTYFFHEKRKKWSSNQKTQADHELQAEKLHFFLYILLNSDQ